MIADMLNHSVSWYRPVPGVDAINSENLGNPTNDTLLKRCVPVSIQPMTAKQAEVYAAFRTQERMHSVYTNHCGPFKRNDYFVYNGRRLTIIGVRNLIELDEVWVLDCAEYDGTDGRR